MEWNYRFDVGAADAGNPQGCGQDHGLDCLCDVDLSLVQSTGATVPHSGLQSAAGFVRWAEEIAGRTEALSALLGDVSVDEMVEHAEQINLLRHDFVGRTLDAAYQGNAKKNALVHAQRSAVKTHVTDMLQTLDVEQVAAVLGEEPSEVVRLVGYTAEDAPTYVAVDHAMRTRPRWGLQDLGEEFGLHIWQIERWSNLIDVPARRGAPTDVKTRAIELLEDGIEANEVSDILVDEFPDEPRVHRGTLYNWKSKARRAAA